jgi:circadian clock protein KaiB
VQESFELEIIDVLVDPQRAEDERILATPSLVKSEPAPVRVLIGDLSNHARVRSVLNLTCKQKEGV